MAPSLRALDKPIAIACFGLRTFRCDRPDSSLPRFISCIARPTLAEAFGLYFRFPEVDIRFVPEFLNPRPARAKPDGSPARRSLTSFCRSSLCTTCLSRMGMAHWDLA